MRNEEMPQVTPNNGNSRFKPSVGVVFEVVLQTLLHPHRWDPSCDH